MHSVARQPRFSLSLSLRPPGKPHSLVFSSSLGSPAPRFLLAAPSPSIVPPVLSNLIPLLFIYGLEPFISLKDNGSVRVWKPIEGFQVAILEVCDTCQWTTNCFFNDFGMIYLIQAVRSSSDEGKLMSSNRHWLHFFSPHFDDKILNLSALLSRWSEIRVTGALDHSLFPTWLTQWLI